MTGWSLPYRYETSAGVVASGRAGHGPPLVLAHGWPWSSYAWHRIIPGLSRRFTVFWYDMPGYGVSGKAPEQATGLDVQGAVFAEMLEHWALERPSVMAHDFGGAAVLRAHVLHGCDYARLVLMNVVAMRPWGSAFFDHVGRHVDAFRGLPPHIHAAVVRAYIEGALAVPLPEEDLAELVAPWLTEAGQVSFYRQFAQADERFTAEIEPEFGRLRCPVTILWGDRDPWIPIERGRALADLVAQGPLRPFAGLGHLPQLEAPERVLEALEDVLPE